MGKTFDRIVQVLILALTGFGAFYIWADHHPANGAAPTAGAAMTPWWAYILVAIGVLALLAQVAMAIRDRWFLAKFQMPLTQIVNQTFKHIQVPMDGFEYVECSFENPVFIYEGKTATRITNCKLSGSKYVILTRNPALQQMLSLQRMLISISGGGMPSYEIITDPEAFKKK